MLRLLGGYDQQVIAWASQMLNKPLIAPMTAFGIVDEDGALKGAAMFSDFYPGGNIELTFVGKGTATRPVARGLIQYAFVDNKAARITAKTRRDNLIVRKLLPRLGFTLEYAQKNYFGPKRRDTALCFVLYKDKVPAWMT